MSSKKLLAFEKPAVARSVCSIPVHSYCGSEYACVQARRVDRKRSVIYAKATCVCLRLPVSASCSAAQERKGDLWLVMVHALSAA